MLFKWRTGDIETHVCGLSRIWLFATPWTVAHQAPLFMGFSRQEYWSGLSSPSPGYLPNPVSNLHLLHCRQILYHWVTGEALIVTCAPLLIHWPRGSGRCNKGQWEQPESQPVCTYHKLIEKPQLFLRRPWTEVVLCTIRMEGNTISANSQWR